ncbi:uncharacterized protein LAESUDRAFT_725215 [Laetiporus sulphureus 93-53]|uniref:Uncharacterized protein n=1 Tax=Laetiporus sulphureus 93-53 TaxID=1314785 RepID=A0A165ELD8_9APHY|nr:uncharacterized protein LAESUDRAFT_725215 [Laetiporus sulphureus 93-53]KZT07301.1 hypothetical protein LAESUDRAFT_725215 [Laetiporus sulphureus 93-53]
MGRPLFSQCYQTPAVRVEPEQHQPTFERWTYLNAFDPDSDEFFGDDAVYEAFVDPAQPGTGGDGEEREQPPALETYSSSSSEASSSGRGSPTSDISPEEINQTVLERVTIQRDRTTVAHRSMPPYLVVPPRHSIRDAPLAYREVAARASPYRPGEMASQHTNTYQSTTARHRQFGERAPPSPSTSSSSAPIPIPDSPRRGMAAPSHSPADPPSTPPSRSPFSMESPSPAPSVTPRLYSWPPRNAVSSYPVSPAPSGPLPNRNARMSVAHIPSSPALVPVSRVVG